MLLQCYESTEVDRTKRFEDFMVNISFRACLFGRSAFTGSYILYIKTYN